MHFQEAGEIPAQVRYCKARYWMLFLKGKDLRAPGNSSGVELLQNASGGFFGVFCSGFSCVAGKSLPR